MEKKNGQIIVVSAPSGAGKTTIVKEIKEPNFEIEPIKIYTSEIEKLVSAIVGFVTPPQPKMPAR